MKPSEALRIVALLKARFVNGAKDFSLEQAAAYCEELLDLDYQSMYVTVRYLARIEPWFPSIARLREAYAEQIIQYPDADELWSRTLYYARKSGFGRNLTIEVPLPVLHLVEFLGGWKEIGRAEDLNVLRAHALRAYPKMRERAIRRVQCGNQEKLKHSLLLQPGSKTPA